jgi:hypothetical protein
MGVETQMEFLNLTPPPSGASPANAVNIFRGHWAYKLPMEGVESGQMTSFFSEPPGVKLLKKHYPNHRDFDLLELGPHEGEHSYHLNSIVRHAYAVEGRPANYLKCLVVKNELGLNNVRFALGDAVEYLKLGKHRWDIGYCAGFLYHMADPAAVIRLLAQRTKRLILTTVVMDWKEMEAADQRTADDQFPTNWTKFIEREPHEVRGYEYFRRIFQSSEAGTVLGHGASHTEYAHLVTAETLKRIIADAGGRILWFERFVDHRSPHVETVVEFV